MPIASPHTCIRIGACIVSLIILFGVGHGEGQGTVLAAPQLHIPGTVLPVTNSSDAEPTARVEGTYGKLPLHFEANQGQADTRVRFLSRGYGYTVFFTATEAVLSVGSKAKGKEQKAKGKGFDSAPE